eukprot:s119_g21.t1
MKTCGGVDIAAHAAITWNMNHAQGCQNGENSAIIGDVTKLECWEQILERAPNFFTVSSSCKSFSPAGNRSGWNSDDAKALAMTIRWLQLHGVEIFVLENVPSLMTHDQWRHQFLELLKYCDFQIRWYAISELGDVHPAERSRLLMLIVKRSEEKQALKHQTMRSNNQCTNSVTLWNAKRWMNLPEELQRDAAVDDDILQTYLQEDRMPHFMRQRIMFSCKSEAQYVRTVKSCEKIPTGTMMASYTNQHSMNGIILGSLRSQENAVRFWHPVELLLAAGTWGDICVPRNLQIAMEGVGNCITEYHAIGALLHACVVIDEMHGKPNIFGERFRQKEI